MTDSAAGRTVRAELPDGDVHTLRFDLEAFIMVEEELDKPLGDAFQQISGLRETRALLRAALSNEEEMRGRRNRPWTDEEIHELMPLGDVQAVREPLREAVEKAMPADDEDEPDEADGADGDPEA